MSIVKEALERVQMPWTFQRALYVLIGGWLVLQSMAEGQWTWTAFGLYFSSMGLFSFGCAAGCGVHLSTDAMQRTTAGETQNAEFEVVETRPSHKAVA